MREFSSPFSALFAPIAACAAIALPLMAVQPSTPRDQGGTLTGKVRTVGGAPIAGARVTLFSEGLAFFGETRTNADGYYRIKGKQRLPLRLGVAAPGFDYQEVAVTLPDPGGEWTFTLALETNIGRWDVIGNTAGQFFDASDIGILLADGRIMYCHDTLTPVIFDPATGQSFAAAGSGLGQGCMNLTLLANGRPIMVGGQPSSAPGDFRNAVRFVKAYSPAADSWQRFADLLNPAGRWYPGMARLADGSLLAMGGGTRPDAVRTATCERLNLSTMTWSWTGSMLNASEFSPAALLFTGEVLATWSPPQLYNPGTGQWRLTGGFNQPSRFFPGHSDHTLIVLSDGRAVAIGIEPLAAAGNTSMSEIYSPATGTWVRGTSPALLRAQPEVVPLPDGKVLVAAGNSRVANPGVPNVRGVVKWTDLYEPLSGAWRRVADMNQFREYHAVTLLVPDGRVLTTGGTVIDFGNPPTSSDVEAFSPPYLFRGVRPSITGLSSATPARGSVVQASIFPQTQITSAVIQGTGATTHWVESGVPRRLVLPVAQNGSTVTLTLPAEPNVLPSGHYMLFLMVDDIPSQARILRVP